MRAVCRLVMIDTSYVTAVSSRSPWGLARTWSPETEGSFLWSSPMGRPLYESLGYTALDECAIWVLGGTEEMLALLGNT